jgi:hypothetical protein
LGKCRLWSVLPSKSGVSGLDFSRGSTISKQTIIFKYYFSMFHGTMQTSNDTGTDDEDAMPQSSVSSTTRHETSETPEGSEVRKEEREEKEKEETDVAEELKKKSSSETATETPEESEKQRVEKRAEEKKGEEKNEKKGKEEKEASRRLTLSSSLAAFQRKCVEGNSASVQSDPPTRRARGRGIDIHRKSRSEIFASATTSSSSVQYVAPPTRIDRGYGLAGSQRNFSSSAKEDEEPGSQQRNISTLPVPPMPLVRGQQLSRPLAFSSPFPSSSASEIHQSLENTQGESLVEANLVTEPDLLVGEIMEDPQPVMEKGFWGRRRVPLLVFILLAIGLAVGVGVGFGLQGGGSTSEYPLFDCSYAALGLGGPHRPPPSSRHVITPLLTSGWPDWCQDQALSALP